MLFTRTELQQYKEVYRTTLFRDCFPFWLNYGWDREQGGIIRSLDRDCRPIRKRRYSFSETFAAMAYGEHYKATGSKESARMAHRLYEVYREHIAYPPKFYATRPMKSLARLMIQVNLCQQLRDSISLDVATDDIDLCIGEIERDFVKDDCKCCSWIRRKRNRQSCRSLAGPGLGMDINTFI